MILIKYTHFELRDSSCVMGTCFYRIRLVVVVKLMWTTFTISACVVAKSFHTVSFRNVQHKQYLSDLERHVIFSQGQQRAATESRQRQQRTASQYINHCVLWGVVNPWQQATNLPYN